MLYLSLFVVITSNLVKFQVLPILCVWGTSAVQNNLLNASERFFNVRGRDKRKQTARRVG